MSRNASRWIHPAEIYRHEIAAIARQYPLLHQARPHIEMLSFQTKSNALQLLRGYLEALPTNWPRGTNNE